MTLSAIPWGKYFDMHTILLNYVYSLYYRPFRQYAPLATIGYWGNPDPRFGAITPDFISCGVEGDVQIIDIKSFYRDDTGEFEYICEDVVQKLEKTYKKYSAIELLNVKPYLKIHKANREPKAIEVVFVLLNEVFEECFSSKTEVSGNYIIWVFDFKNDSPILKKVLGNHKQQDLEKTVQKIFFKPDLHMLIRYFRNSSLKNIKLCFSQYLMHSCLQDQKIDFAFDEIDDIMVTSQLPLLGHLSKKERGDFWRSCLRFLVDVAKVVKPSKKGPSHYTWEAKILRSPYYREQTLEKIKEKLGRKKDEHV
ncbi:MAG: hypothetical protein PVF58_15490 [Candidatus Methanofastidiosia archaeon]|jgi:hypothetical protein